MNVTHYSLSPCHHFNFAVKTLRQQLIWQYFTSAIFGKRSCKHLQFSVVKSQIFFHLSNNWKVVILWIHAQLCIYCI